VVQASAIVEMLVGRVPRTDRDQCPSVMKRSFCAAAIASNDRFPFRKLPLREAPVKGYFWPKAALRRHRESDRLCDNHEGLESTRNGHSSLLTQTSAIRSQNGRSIAAIS